MGLGESRRTAELTSWSTEFPDEMGDRKPACGVVKELEVRLGGESHI